MKTNTMGNLPAYIHIVFGLSVLMTFLFFYKAINKPPVPAIIALLWILLQSIVSLTGFFTVTDSMPPRLILLVSPSLLVIVILFLSAEGRKWIDRLNIRTLTLLHIIRIPVEIVIFWLFLHKALPVLMTFEGRNLDILSGITAPLVYYFGFRNNKVNRKLLLIWNIVCVALLINIVTLAILSAPFPFQKFAFEQPDIAVLYFPFTLLPGFIVPLVLLSHLAAIRQLLKSDNIRN